MGIRTSLSSVLAGLSTWAVAKHEMKLIVVAGTHGTKLTGELIGEMLSPDYAVRRQLEKPFWDFSIPLAILGIEDRRYSILEWIVIIVRTFFLLLLGRRNQTWTILQMNTYKPEIAQYWSRFIRPDVLVLVHQDEVLRDLEELLISRTKKLVVVSSFMKKRIHLLKGQAAKVISVGKDKSADLQIISILEEKRGTKISAKWNPDQEKVQFFAFQKGQFLEEPMILAIGVLLGMHFSSIEISERLLHSQIDLNQYIITAQT